MSKAIDEEKRRRTGQRDWQKRVGQKPSKPFREVKGITASTFLETLDDFALRADVEAFKKIFGDRIGAFLWDKFLGHDYDIMKLYSHLDTVNRKKLAEGIEHWAVGVLP